MCSRFSLLRNYHHDHACPDDLDNILMIISFSLHGVPYARQEHHGKASANILQIANHHHHHRHHHRHHHCVIITVSSSSPLWTLSALHLQPWWSSQFTAPDREGGKANIVQIVQTWLKPKCCQAPHNASWSYYIMFIVNHCDCKSHGIQLLFGIGRHQMKVGKKMSKETVSCVRVHTRPLRHLPDCHS